MNKIAIYTNRARSSKNYVWLKRVLKDIYRNLWFIKCFKMSNCCIFYGHTFTYTPKNFKCPQFSHSVMSDSLQSRESQHARPPCPSPTPGVHSNYMHWVGDAIQLSHPLSSPSPPAPNPSQHQSLFQWVNFSHEVAKVLDFSFSIIPSKEHPWLISFRMDLTRWNFVGKVMSLLLNMLSRLVITFLPRSKRLLISWFAITICSDFGAPQIIQLFCLSVFPLHFLASHFD